MKGILFREELFPLVVDGSKTQTRRIIKPQPSYSNLIGIVWKGLAYGIGLLGDRYKTALYNFSKTAKPRYKVSETCYLKEPYYKYGNGIIWYRYDGMQKEMSWGNKLFMPESAARYFIEITAVRAERLQDISEEDCLNEGIINRDNAFFFNGLKRTKGCYKGGYKSFSTAKYAYADLINSINGKGTWESNPYVWVYDFKMSK